MKTILIIIGLLASVGTLSQDVYASSPRQKSTINWNEHLSLQQVKSLAKSKKKYIFLDTYASWCIPCKKMDTEVYTSDSVINEISRLFVAFKLQMDTTSHDSQIVKKHYKDARFLNSNYKVEGYPSLLFFTPEGKLAFKSLGYLNVKDILKVFQKATSPDNPKYYKLLDDFQRGKKDYSKLGSLSLFVHSVLSDKKLAEQIAAEYKIHFLDSIMDESSAITKENLIFLNQFNKMIYRNDNVFKIFYSKPDYVDSIYGQKGWALWRVEQAVTRELLRDRLVLNNKLVTVNPDWDGLENIIKNQYPKLDARKLVLDFEIVYYKFYDKDWRKWAISKDKSISVYPPSGGPLSIYIELNTYGAWDTFLHCNDDKVLEMSLSWINLAIALDTTFRPAYFDTKANVLYKLGRVQEALALQAQAVKLAPDDKEIQLVFEQMKRRLPTYQKSGAEWENKKVDRLILN